MAAGWPLDPTTAQLVTDEPGKQLLAAGLTPVTPQLDGALRPEEWQAAIMTARAQRSS